MAGLCCQHEARHGEQKLSVGQLMNRLIVQEAGEGYQLKFSAPAEVCAKLTNERG